MAVLFLFSVGITAQEKTIPNIPTQANFIGSTGPATYVPSMASRKNEMIPVDQTPREIQDNRSSKNQILIGKDRQTQDDYYARYRNEMEQTIKMTPPSLVFDAYVENATPTDPSIAIGPNHVFVVFNTGFSIFDKSGNLMFGPVAPNPAIFPSSGCCDLTASYDAAADRWVITFLGSGAQVAVSDGPDPINDGWFTYNIGAINDYQKLSVWSDGYYLTDNTSSSNRVWAMERTEMLAGNAAQILGFNLPGIATSGFYSPQALNVSDANMPAAGGATFLYLQDDAWSGVSTDHVKLWTLDVDWNAGNGVMSAATELPATPYISVFDGGSFSNLEQPGGSSVDALQATIMNQAQFRKFANHNSALFNFVIDTDATSGELAGVRWYELRQDDDNMPWTVYQEGTYMAPDGRHAWHASMIMDVQGNIGMGYTSMAGPTTPNPTNFRISSYYTGRFAADPIGTMTVIEELIAAGGQNIPSTRYGDYSKIDVDPSDDKTFWFINEYQNGGRKGVVGVFKIAPDFANDAGVVSIDSPSDGLLGASEQVTVSIFNYGQNSQSNIPVNLTIDGNSIADEVFAGPLASSTSAQYTFTATGDFSIEGHTYVVEASTGLGSDQDDSNDLVIENITHMFASDLGATAITEPVSGEGLGFEAITITIENFGGAEQTNFDVSYSINGGTTVVETFTGSVNPGETENYTFSELGDFSEIGTYTISSSTELSGDSDADNDTVEVDVVNVACTSETNSTTMPIGPDSGTVTSSVISYVEDFLVNDVNVTVNLNHTYDGDIDIKLVGPDNSVVMLSNRHGGSGNDYINTVFDDEAANPISGGAPPFTGTFQPDGNLSDFNGLSTSGDWTLVITDNAGGDSGTLNSWTIQLCGDPTLGVSENNIEDADLLILNRGNNQFNITLPTTTITEKLTLTVTNMLGQQLLSYNLNNEGVGYEYDLNMSYADTGVYIVRIGNSKMGIAKRIIVE